MKKEIPKKAPVDPSAKVDPKTCPHKALVYVRDDYGSLADGGSYEVYDCARCGKRLYVMLPD